LEVVIAIAGLMGTLDTAILMIFSLLRLSSLISVFEKKRMKYLNTQNQTKIDELIFKNIKIM